MRITVFGAGNGALALASRLTCKGHHCTMFNRTPTKYDDVMTSGCLKVRFEGSERWVRIHKIADLAEDAIAGSKLIVVAVPVTGQGYYAQLIAKSLHDDQIILLAPGHTGGALQFCKYLRDFGYKGKQNVYETSTLPYVCRVEADKVVAIYREAKHVLLGSIGGDSQMLRTILRLFPQFVPVDNVLVSSLSNINSVLHPPGMLVNAGYIERMETPFTFYYEGATSSVASLIAELDKERCSIADSLGLKVDPFIDIFHKWGYTSDEAWEQRDIKQAMLDSIPNQSILCPTSLDTRYIHEDVGYGLVPIKYFGCIAGVETPVMDSFIKLFSIINSRDYLSEGLTLEKMGLPKKSNRGNIFETIHKLSEAV
ncbi:MAG TPA: hypothetical protein GX734_00845 [Clostridiaceae bacterium]|nr:hypothetical protein [Clostridiaceae bacterium]